MIGIPDFSVGATKASVEPSADNARWLTSPATGMANCRGTVGEDLRARDQVAAATAINPSAAPAQRQAENFEGGRTTRVAALASLPESALSAKDRSLAD